MKNLSAGTIKLGVDAHLESYMVAIKVDESAPLRPRRLNLVRQKVSGKRVRQKGSFRNTIKHFDWI